MCYFFKFYFAFFRHSRVWGREPCARTYKKYNLHLGMLVFKQSDWLFKFLNQSKSLKTSNFRLFCSLQNSSESEMTTMYRFKAKDFEYHVLLQSSYPSLTGELLTLSSKLDLPFTRLSLLYDVVSLTNKMIKQKQNWQCHFSFGFTKDSNKNITSLDPVWHNLKGLVTILRVYFVFGKILNQL